MAHLHFRVCKVVSAPRKVLSCFRVYMRCLLLQVRAPSPLLPPHGVVAAQMEALHRNDWPHVDAGLETAFAFAMPQVRARHALMQRAWRSV